MTSDLRIKIAESLGWKKDYPAYDDYDREIVSWRKPMGRGPLNEAYIRNYDADANAALQLVEVLKKEGWEWMSGNTIGEGPSLIFFQFMKFNPYICHLSNADTLPEAICLAYAKVKRIEV